MGVDGGSGEVEETLKKVPVLCMRKGQVVTAHPANIIPAGLPPGECPDTVYRSGECPDTVYRSGECHDRVYRSGES